MRIIIFGGTGFLGTRLVNDLRIQPHEVVVVTRNTAGPPPAPNVTLVDYDNKKLQPLFSGNYAVINFAGAGIADKLWTPSRKALILNSRVEVTQRVADLVNNARKRPQVILQASAVGYYGSRGEEPLTELSEKGSGFLPDVVEQWESALDIDFSTRIRIVLMRTGLVLGDQGLVQKLVPAFKLFLGGHIGNGQQWMPWIHIDDHIDAMLFLLANENARGVFNLTAPDPVRMKEFTSILGRTLNRPSWLPIPAFLFRMIPYDFGKELALSSQYVLPERLMALGFKYTYTDLEKAFINLFYYA